MLQLLLMLKLDEGRETVSTPGDEVSGSVCVSVCACACVCNSKGAEINTPHNRRTIHHVAVMRVHCDPERTNTSAERRSR